MKVSVTWGFWSGRYYYVRLKGWVASDTAGAKRLDTKEKVPDEWFRKGNAPAREQTARGDKIAASYAAHREREVNDEGGWKPTRMNLAEIGELYKRKRRNEVVGATIVRDGQMIDRLVAFFDERDPSTIDISAMEDYRDDRLTHEWTPRLGDKGVRSISPRTVANECAFGWQLLKWAYAHKSDTGMTRLELHGVPDVLGKRRTRGRVLTMEEFWLVYEKALLRPRVGRRSQRMLALGLATWLRKDPLTNLDASWISRHDATVTIPAEYMKGRDGEKRPLTLPLCRFAMAHLEESLTSGCMWGVNRATGEPAVNLFHTLAAIAVDAGIRAFSLHDLRRTGNSLLLNHRCEKHPTGAPKQVRDKILAHSMPLNDEAYTQIDMETMRDALSIIDEEWDAYQVARGNVVPFIKRA